MSLFSLFTWFSSLHQILYTGVVVYAPALALNQGELATLSCAFHHFYTCIAILRNVCTKSCWENIPVVRTLWITVVVTTRSSESWTLKITWITSYLALSTWFQTSNLIVIHFLITEVTTNFFEVWLIYNIVLDSGVHQSQFYVYIPSYFPL